MRFALGLLVGLSFTAWSWGDDRVTIIPRGATDPVVLIGSIEDVTGDVLLIKRAGQTVSDRYPAETVISIQTWRTEVHEQGLAELKQGKNAPAEQALQQALREESRDWILREILADLIRCAIRRGDWETAGERFRQIVDQDPLTSHWNVAPLYWAPHALGDSQKAVARQWIREKNSPLQLLAASWLLLDPVYGEPAGKRLDDLARSPNSIVAKLARCQLWRLRLGAEINELDLGKWQQDVTRLPRSLRAGPQYLIGRGRQQRNEWRTAAAELLWVGLVYTDHEDLSARALIEAAGALEKSGQPEEALTLYNLCIERFEWSPWSNEARSARSVLSSSTDSRENTQR